MTSATLTPAPTLDAALRYAKNLPGRLLPIPEGQKAAQLRKWPTAASKDPGQIEEWFSRPANIGFIPDRGVFVLDLDRKADKDGFTALGGLESEFSALPATLTASTPSGGQHRYFRGPDLPYRTAANACGLPGVDFRCAQRHDGTGAGYVVMPPSTVAGRSYTWLNWPDTSEPPHIAEAPRWLVDLAAGADPRKMRLACQTSGKPVEPDQDQDQDRDQDRDQDVAKHLASALQVLDCNNYDIWISIGLALKTLEDDAIGLHLWLNWSAGSAKFDEADALARWTGFEPEHTHYRTIFTLAQCAGWANPGGVAKSIKGTEADEVAEFNETHAVVITGGSVCILREGVSEFGGSMVHFMAKHAFGTYYENRTLRVDRVTPDGIQQKRMPLARAWLSHPNRRTHEGVTCAPAGDVPAGFYNLWRGYAVEPLPLGVAGSALRCKGFMHHLKSNICRGNKHYFRYLLAWMADMVQDPMRKKGVALVLRGKKGTGKSTLADALRAILGGHAFKASKSEHIVGRFSAHLADKLLLVAEESFFAGSHAEIGTLKDLITSNTITVEPKHVGAFELRSCHRICMLTNSEWAVPATEDERRFFVLDVGEDRMQDTEYFGAIDQELRGEGLRAFLTLLQKFDLSAWNLRKVPQTEALKTQKQLSLESHDHFILDCLTSGEICGHAWLDNDDDGDWKSPLRSDVYSAYVAYARASSVRPIAANRFGPKFTTRTGAGSYQPTGTDRRRCYLLPDRTEALQRFEQQTGISTDEC
ncbi:MAG TPA: bifunctional DNA primase/polymerase [Accumulibacter sp.]|nr:bifunctional DNA primase/polymerase [Accumulibacter sp.]